MENHLKDGLYPFSMRDTLKGKAAFSMPRLWIVFGLKGMTYLRNMDNAQPSLISLKLFNFFIYGTMVIFTGFFQLYLQDIGMSKIEIGDLMAIAPFVSIFANPFWGFWGSGGKHQAGAC